MPDQVMFLVTSEIEIINAARDLMYMLFFIEIGLGVYTIYYNAIVGTGAITVGLIINAITAVVYIGYINIMVTFQESLLLAWSSEFVFAFIVLTLSAWYLHSNRWRKVSF